MKTTAAILVETAKPLELWDIEIPSLRAGQVLVEVVFSGACRTQIMEAWGMKGEDKWLPHCLGHEGVGRVLEDLAVAPFVGLAHALCVTHHIGENAQLAPTYRSVGIRN